MSHPPIFATNLLKVFCLLLRRVKDLRVVSRILRHLKPEPVQFCVAFFVFGHRSVEEIVSSLPALTQIVEFMDGSIGVSSRLVIIIALDHIFTECGLCVVTTSYHIDILCCRVVVGSLAVRHIVDDQGVLLRKDSVLKSDRYPRCCGGGFCGELKRGLI